MEIWEMVALIGFTVALNPVASLRVCENKTEIRSKEDSCKHRVHCFISARPHAPEGQEGWAHPQRLPVAPHDGFLGDWVELVLPSVSTCATLL
jgi:hypothetical protein